MIEITDCIIIGGEKMLYVNVENVDYKIEGNYFISYSHLPWWKRFLFRRIISHTPAGGIRIYED